jgi:hypothetical protein
MSHSIQRCVSETSMKDRGIFDGVSRKIDRGITDSSGTIQKMKNLFFLPGLLANLIG